MATDMFLDIAEIKGEATQKHGKDMIDVHSMSFGVVQPTAVGRTGGGQTTGKAVFQEIHFTKFSDKSSPKLYNACAKGSHLPQAVFSGWKASGDAPVLYFKVTLTDVVVSSFQNSGAAGSETSESLSFTYGKIAFEYVEHKTDGTLGPKNLAEFNAREGHGA